MARLLDKSIKKELSFMGVGAIFDALHSSWHCSMLTSHNGRPVVQNPAILVILRCISSIYIRTIITIHIIKNKALFQVLYLANHRRKVFKVLRNPHLVVNDHRFIFVAVNIKHFSWGVFTRQHFIFITTASYDDKKTHQNYHQRVSIKFVLTFHGALC